jgi:hypothetical protein
MANKWVLDLDFLNAYGHYAYCPYIIEDEVLMENVTIQADLPPGELVGAFSLEDESLFDRYNAGVLVATLEEQRRSLEEDES